jgi:hypothetical protein
VTPAANFSKIIRDIRNSDNLPPVSTTPQELVAKFASGIVDTGGKFAAGVINNNGNLPLLRISLLIFENI